MEEGPAFDDAADAGPTQKEIGMQHPCEGMTELQIAAFERIASGEPPNCTWPEIDALMARGLIERGPNDTRRDAMGLYHIPSFLVPVPVHIAWCKFCDTTSK